MDDEPVFKSDELIMDTVVKERLDNAKKVLGIDFPIPKVAIKRIDEDFIARTDILSDGSFQASLGNGSDQYDPERRIGMVVHEVAHIAMWGLTGEVLQPATHLVDEGWAKLIEMASTKITVEEIQQEIAGELNTLKTQRPDIYERCSRFDKAVADEEIPNLPDGMTVGTALVFWIKENYGNEAMVRLLKESPYQIKWTGEPGKTTDEQLAKILTSITGIPDIGGMRDKMEGWYGVKG
ncbi:MAG: hypothetical protein WC596_03640 [Candidatus Shapirobacteria bacterium]